MDHLPEGVAHFGQQLLSYLQGGPEGPISLQFSDGSTTTCDILVGCDGIQSCVRGQMLRVKSREERRPELLDLVEPVWTGTIAYRGLVPIKKMPRGPDGALHRTGLSPMMVRQSLEGQNMNQHPYNTTGKARFVSAFEIDGS